MPRRDSDIKARLLATFRVEAREHLDSVAASLVALAAEPVGERAHELVEATFREMHTLKGAARSVSLRDIERLCQACESVLSTLARGHLLPDRALLDRLEESVDAIGRLVAEDGHAVAIGALVDGLERAGADPGSADAAPVAVAAPARTEHADAPARDATIRLDAAKLDRLLLRGEELLPLKLAADEWVAEAEALVADLRRSRTQDAAVRAAEARAIAMRGRLARDRRTIAAAVDGLLDETRRVRMMPASTVLELFPMMVRDIARREGKEVAWAAEGGELEVDRKILEAVKDPLIHLVRNAVDHGIEPPSEREAAGKPRCGTVAASVRPVEGGRIEIAVRDDGRGLDPAGVREAAVRARIVRPDVAEELTDDSTQELIFRSGVSTSFVITDVSGHGLGLAIVKERVERLGGEIRVDSRPGAGMAVQLTLPATIATFRGVLVRARGQQFLISIDAVERAVRLEEGEPLTVQGRAAIRREGHVLPVAHLDALLGIAGDGAGDGRSCLIVGAGGDRAGLCVDEVLGDREVLVKELAPPLEHVRHVAGAGLLGAGELTLILRPADLVEAVRQARPARSEARAESRQPRVLVVDDALTTRVMERSLLETAGYRVDVAADGLEAWSALKRDAFDLVVSDVDMPRLDGFELTARIRADPELAELPVVLVTALEGRADKERGIEVGANAYVVKSSFDQSNLLEIIRRLGVSPEDEGRP